MFAAIVGPGVALGVALGVTFAAGTAHGEEPGLVSEPPRGTYVRVHGSTLADPVGPQAADIPPHILFLQRCSGGLDLTPGPNDSIGNTSSIPTGPITLPEYPFGNESWQEVVAQTRDVFAPFNIDVTDVDPGNVPHDEAVVCGDGSGVAPGAGGVAPFDCGIIMNPITFTFPEVLGNNPRLIAEVIGQEAAHAWGLDHELLCEDPMTYLSGCGQKSFQDIDAECGEFEARPCDCGIPLQNSYQHILGAFGPRIPDVDGPIVTITAPLSGSTFEAGDNFTVIVDIIDDSIVDEAELHFNGMPGMIDNLEPWGWQINDVEAGLYTLEVTAIDEYGNAGLSIPVSILVGDAAADGTAGDDEADDVLDGGTASDGGDTDSAGADEDPKGCGCRSTATQGPWFAAMPLLLLGLRRRRTHARRPR
ncbi:Ig-like domain-containing protein [Paraliomyxa miuraensis]|uniref:Ig-like domain-containing protein n=1 Tax=Paraliomyxa miuraensis TaxID=376150 RepID=UPI0022590C32|nr:Ig-like domain-containing protein [Paraliomyxa miuraensis]MCX4245676.1 Ig-like domain-containing protein [Paraliomyxa miuraensis]